VTPAERVGAACDRWGEGEVVRRCAAQLVAGPAAPTGELLDLAEVLGGLRDRDFLAGGRPPGHAYWARVWAARALRYVWADFAAPAVVAALDDEYWRVREMAAKVVADQELADAADRLVELLGDDTARVRIAAARALGGVGEGEHGKALLAMVASDPDRAVARTAASALQTLSRRLDRRF
jgi:HEAT repeat protein